MNVAFRNMNCEKPRRLKLTSDGDQWGTMKLAVQKFKVLVAKREDCMRVKMKDKNGPLNN